ncbi:MAG TPA: hypothetical protein VIT45_11380 [Allosphingosinicella sp.]
MKAEISRKRGMADEFAARASTLRRVAGDMKETDDRAELLRIAETYEEDAARLRNSSPTAG